MVASNDTVIDMLRVLRKHLDHETLMRVLKDLKEVDGNQSFRQTIARMYDILHNRSD